MKNPLVISASIAALIVVIAVAVLGVLSAFAGEKSGLDKSGRHACPLSVKVARDVTAPDYGKRLTKLAHCSG